MPKTIINLISDLHLECREKIPDDLFPQNKGDIKRTLILAGDIGDPFSQIFKDFLFYCSKQYDNVIFVPGNHEYYNDFVEIKQFEKNKDFINRFKYIDKNTKKLTSKNKIHSISDINKQMRKVCGDVGVFFLSNSYIIIDDIKYIGSTFWSNISRNNIINIGSSKPNIFKYIYVNDRCITPETYNKLHKEAYNFLKNEIYKSELKTVVITHHSPLYNTTNDRFPKSNNDEMYCTNCPELFSPSISAWFHGHLHDSKTKNVNGVEISSNSYGHEKEFTKFNFYRKEYSIVL